MARDDLRALIVDRIRSRGPMTFAAFMDIALYHPELGYSARAAQQSGRAGDFFTSVDIGPEFGQLLAVQFAEMWCLLDRPRRFDLVEAGAGRGRLARDILDAVARLNPKFYDAIRLTLIDRSPTAQAAQPETLGPHSAKVKTTGNDIPERIVGVLFANELLDALPFHVVAMTSDGLREIVVDAHDDHLVERLVPPTSHELTAYLESGGVRLEERAEVEISLQSIAWTRQAAGAIERGFLMIIDYGHDAARLLSAGSGGTRSSYRHHVQHQAAAATRAPWLDDPGGCDITAHVDVTSVARAAVCAGMVELGRLDQTYFLLGLLERSTSHSSFATAPLRHRLALKTLLLPGGLGSTHKVLIFGRNVDRPTLLGCSYASRLT